MSYSSTGDLSTLTSAAGAVVDVANDPHLPEVICEVQRLSLLEQGKPLPAPCTKIPLKAGTGKGIGLRYAVVPLRLAVKVREKPWIVAAVALGIGASIFTLGYTSGRRSKS